uniref:Type I polyketide synthase n=1 Tax=Gambierdiscus excentricus TaxID=986170 RepID=A0A1S6K7U8_9DINO|nr:type I polyketide synthase [Gambierdiscus excentricus]
MRSSSPIPMALVQKSECDVSFSDGDSTGVSVEILSCLQTKGFCVLNPGLVEADLKKAREEISSAQNTGKLQRPPEMIVEGLLGLEGSARIMDLGIPDQDSSENPVGLTKLDAAMSETASIINEFIGDLGFICPTRTAGLVHESGDSADEPPELGLEEASTWLTTFLRHKLMILLCLGPIQGTLELHPFDEDAEVYEVPTTPGTIIVLRADAMTHRHFAHSAAFLMSCFLLESDPGGRFMVAMQELGMVPVAKEIHDWTINKMKEIKEAEYEYHQPADIPQSWLTAMNHMFCLVQRIAVRGISGRYPATFSPREWSQSHTFGIDYVTEVPVTRWRLEDTYDPEPECWRWGKVFSKHGGFMDGAELFEPRFFGLSPQEAKGMDPTQRVVLEVGYEALWMAGYKKGKLMNSLGGVYVGTGATIFGMVAEVSGATGAAASINSNRFSFCLGLKGPSMTVDTEGSSGLTAVYLGAEATLDKGRGAVNAYSMSGGIHIQMGTIWYPQLQSAGLLGKKGRCFTWDSGADGYCVGDGSSMFCLKRLTENVQGEQVYIEGEPLCGTLAGCSMSSNGKNSTMNAPHGPAEQELVAETVRQAWLAPVNIDAFECNGEGAFMADAIEVDSLARVLRGADQKAQLQLTSTKSIEAYCNEGAGAISFAKAVLANNWGSICPNQHLKQINPHIDPEAKIGLMTEASEYPLFASYTGAMSRGFGGTNVCAVVLGERDPSRLDPLPAEFKRNYITFWPGGGGELESSQEPRRGYYISGSWSGWIPESMQQEEEGSYGYTLTLGENRWEDFQIWLDGDKAKSLHPDMLVGHKGAPVVGPDHRVRGYNWRVTGSSEYVQPIEPKPTSGEGGEIEVAATDLKVVSVGAPHLGQIGDQYRVHLKIAGKFRSVTWEKVGSVDPSLVPVSEYYITSDWNGWTLEKMMRDGDVWNVEVQLLRKGGEFQIVRNQDWGQMFCSDTPGASETSVAHGPYDVGMARTFSWYLKGIPGDYFCISFERKTKEVRWEKLKNEPLTDEQKLISKRAVVSVVGSWSDGYRQSHLLWGGAVTANLPWAGSDAPALYHFFVEIGPDGQESFQLLQDGSWDIIVHPNVPIYASKTPHWLMTSPNTGEALRLVWVLGGDDGATPGDIFKVKVATVGSRVSRVTWAKAERGEELDEAVANGLVLRGD